MEKEYFYTVALLSSAHLPFTYTFDKPLKTGQLVDVPLRSKIKPAVILDAVSKPSFTCKDICEVKKSFYAPWQIECAKFIASFYGSAIGEALALMVPYQNKKTPVISFSSNASIALSPAQTKARDFLNSQKNALLFGDTGSGKTEIYLSMMQEFLKKDQSVIFLMPEIGLTPQMQTRLERYFGPRVALWHSKLTKKKKETVLKDIYDGVVRIVAGPRSALFLPMDNLGLIVVDEEHDESYKSNSRPRYNARDLALWLGQKRGVKVVLGSATPSLQAYTKLPTVRLRGTYFASSRKVYYEPGLHEMSDGIVNQIKKTLKKGRQAIVFVPTRAHFKALVCRDCGSRVECPYCAVSMSVHRNQNALICHYCNFAQPIPNECPTCKGKTIEANRIGTAEVVKNLCEALPEARIGQFDRDAIKTERQLKKLLKAFNNKELDILVGTQMLSKGHDYHDIGLSVIIGLDAQLSMPDFRAREKALALALQIAGRSGRKGEGEVLIQTYNSDFFKTYMDDYESFLKDEIIARKGLYPPFTRLSRLLISSKDESTCKKVLKDTLKILKQFEPNVEVVGSGIAGIGKIAGKFRYHILLRSTSAKALVLANSACRNSFVEIDMDPLSFS